MVEVVPHDGRGLIEQARDLGIGLAGEDFGQEVCVVGAAGFDEEFLDGSALAVSWVLGWLGLEYLVLFFAHRAGWVSESAGRGWERGDDWS